MNNKCPKCKKGILLPFSRGRLFGGEVMTIGFWRCTSCKFRIDYDIDGVGGRNEKK